MYCEVYLPRTNQVIERKQDMKATKKNKTIRQMVVVASVLLIPYVGITQEMEIIEGSVILPAHTPTEDSLAMVILKAKGKISSEDYERMKKAQLINERKEVLIKEEE